MPRDPYVRVTSLRRHLPADRAGALADQARGRESLKGRHPRSGELHVTAASAAQASSWVASRWRARRFQGASMIADLGCGIGVDSLALCESGSLVAVEVDPVRACLARANLVAAAPTNRFTVLRARVPDVMPAAALAFVDPDRRPQGIRVVDPEQGSPPLSELLDVGVGYQGMGIKLSPMADLASLEGHGELEFISVGRELKEIVLWTGELASGGRRVSIPEDDHSLEGAPEKSPPPQEPVDFLHDPNPALIRSGLLGLAAGIHGLFPIDADIAYLGSHEKVVHPLFRSWRILSRFRNRPRDVARFLKDQGFGRLTASRRGFPVSPDEYLALVRNSGEKSAHLVLTRVMGEPAVFVVVPLESP